MLAFELNFCLVYMETSIQTGVSSSLTAPRCLQHVNLSFLCQRDLCLPLTARVSAVYLSWAHLWSAFTFKCSGLVLATYCALNVWDALKTVYFTELSHISARVICIYSPWLLQSLWVYECRLSSVSCFVCRWHWIDSYRFHYWQICIWFV